ncbi:hypothetical protein ACFQV8_23745 [Pseudonocardia benzenivorans]
MTVPAQSPAIPVTVAQIIEEGSPRPRRARPSCTSTSGRSRPGGPCRTSSCSPASSRGCVSAPTPSCSPRRAAGGA